MRIAKHEKSHIVELEDGSAWRIWPGDFAATLLWMPSTQLAVSEIDDECCTHVLVDRLYGMRVRVIEAEAAWAPEMIEASLLADEIETPVAGIRTGWFRSRLTRLPDSVTTAGANSGLGNAHCNIEKNCR